MGDHDEAPRGLQQPSERGYAHMRQSQEAEWDTLDDLDTSKIATLQELYHAVWALSCANPIFAAC